jgi:hypothetical protein
MTSIHGKVCFLGRLLTAESGLPHDRPNFRPKLFFVPTDQFLQLLHLTKLATKRGLRTSVALKVSQRAFKRRLYWIRKFCPLLPGKCFAISLRSINCLKFAGDITPRASFVPLLAPSIIAHPRPYRKFFALLEMW